VRVARWAGLLVLVCTGCADDRKEYAGLSFDVQSAPPLPASVESDRIELVVGVAVQVGVEPVSTGGREYSEDDLLALRADDADVLGVYATEDARTFVLVGVREGDTCLQVKINRREQECIDVRVLAADE
jgi:hypothetical protein